MGQRGQLGPALILERDTDSKQVTCILSDEDVQLSDVLSELGSVE